MAARVLTTPRKRPRQERSRDTVEALMIATARVLIEVGYDHASTNRIAETAGISIGSLYQYFPNKEALVAELCKRQGEKEFQILFDQMEQVAPLPLRRAIPELIRAIISAHRVEPKLHKVLMEQVPRVGALKNVRDLERRIGDLLRIQLEARRRQIRPRHLEHAVFILMHAVEAVTHAAVLDNPEYLDSDKLVEELSDLVMRYLVP